jgi:thiamine pyrophosphate-dependent acetolactate synthase large subunit-like protein
LWLLGARTGFLLGGRSAAVIPNSGCKLVQIDIDAGEIGKSHAVDLGIVSDATKFIVALLDKLSGSSGDNNNNNPIKPQSAWLEDLQTLTTHKPQYADDAELNAQDGRLHPFFAMKAVYEALPSGSIVIIDGGGAGVWAIELLDPYSRAAGCMVSTGYLGFLGNGWGYSIGAVLAAPNRLVVNVQGDGSARFHLQELDTYARHRLNVLTVVMNNYVWGMSVAGQDLLYKDDDPARVASKLSPECRYDVVAQGFGCKAALAQKSVREVRDAVKSLTATRGPALLNAIISRHPITATTMGTVGKTDDKNWIVVPYYDNIPTPYYKGDDSSTTTTDGTAK